MTDSSLQFEMRPLSVTVTLDKFDLYVYPGRRHGMYNDWPYDRIIFPRATLFDWTIIDEKMETAYTTLTDNLMVNFYFYGLCLACDEQPANVATHPDNELCTWCARALNAEQPEEVCE